MSLAAKKSRRIVVGDRAFRWRVFAESKPEFGFVAESEDSALGRLVVRVGVGYTIAPRIVAASIERALGELWDGTERAVTMACPVELLSDQERAQSPCCDSFSIAARGQYAVWAICGWEDDGIDVDRLDQDSLPNHTTLREAREVFRRTAEVDVSRFERHPRTLPEVFDAE